MTTSKSQWRKSLIADRKAVADSSAAAKDVAAALMGYLGKIGKTQTIAGYVPMQGELDILPAMHAVSAAGHPTCLPVVEGTQRMLLFRAWKPGEPLKAGAFGTQAPDALAQPCTPDLLLVPLVGVDARGVRLGYGGGYYDATLAGLRGVGREVVALGVAYDCQRVPELPHEAHDVVLDGVISQSGLVFFDSAGQKKA